MRFLLTSFSDVGADADRMYAALGIFIAQFLPILHEAISEGLAEAVDDIQVAGALQLGDGWMHIHGQQTTS